MFRRGMLAFLTGIAFGTFIWAQAPESIARPRPAPAGDTTGSAPQPGPAQRDSAPAPSPPGFKQAETAPPGSHVVPPGTRILLNMVNSVSTRKAEPGDRIYLETAFPIVSGGKIIIPQRSWVQGTITQLKRPGRIKGRAQLFVRFDTLILPNGTTRDFRARMGAMDGRSTEDINREEGKIKAQGNKAGDAATVGEVAITGAGVGALAGAAAGSMGKGSGIGAAAGAGAGLLGVLMTRGPEATLTRGTTMEMVLDRPLTFTDFRIGFQPHRTKRVALRRLRS